MFADFVTIARQRKVNYPSERTGQAYMNALWFYDPEIHSAIYGTDADCFYDDGRLGQFFVEVIQQINLRESENMDRSNWPRMARSIWPDGEQV